jgi:hypothetical protein
VANRCKVCDHPARMAIDLELTAGDSDRAIASRYGLNRAAVERHKRNHLRPKVKRAMARRSDKDTDTLIAAVLTVIAETQAILEGATDPDLKLRAIDRLHRGLDLRGRVTGEIAPPQVQNFVLSLGMTEAQVRSMAESHKALESYSWEDGERDAVDGLRLIIEEHPERAGPIRLALFGDVQVEEE